LKNTRTASRRLGVTQLRGRDFQIIDEALVFARPRVLVRQPQQVGRVHRHQRLAPAAEIDRPAAVMWIGVILPNTLCAASFQR